MTNETTASQPKSIGDDAQFLDWLKAWSHEYENRLRDSDVDDITKQVAAYIDSRAPAAQASATIQAAPETWEERTTWRPSGYCDSADASKAMQAEIKEWRALFAATIQEPVMVAEPVSAPHLEPVGHVKDYFPGTDKAYRQVVWADRTFAMDVPDGAPLFAAPMVADPAGVAKLRAALVAAKGLFDECSMTKGPIIAMVDDALAAPMVADPCCVAVPELAVWYGSLPESNGKMNFTAILLRKGSSLSDGGEFTIEQSEYPDRVRYEADRMRHLIGELSAEPDILDYDAEKHSGYVPPAATVKAVPSEALDAAVYQVELDASMRTWMDVDAKEVSTWKRKKFNVRVFAAPLADKTGGGE